MAESAVNSAALWLGKLMVEEMNYLGAITGKVEFLKTELDILAAFLTDVALRSHRQKNVVRTALLQARNIAYDCEDVIENYILQVAHHGYEDYEGCQLGSVMRWGCLVRKAAHVHGIHYKIDELNGRFAALKSCIVSYGVSDRIVAAEINPSLGHQAGPVRDFVPHDREVAVGLDSQLEELGSMLLDTTDHRVIVIWGMGGIGKSMLARKLYHLRTLKGGDGFEAFGWVSVSQQFQEDRVLQTLLISLVPENDIYQKKMIRIKESKPTVRVTPQAELCELMREVKCLVVIDDIWNPNDWERLKPAFPMDGKTQSRILLTTRKEDILSGLNQSQVHLHPVKGLDEDKSWELFQETAFPHTTCTDSKKVELGREMLQHCKGVPLAIVVLAKVLERKQREEEWIQMRDDIDSHIRRGGTPNLYKGVYDVLQLSYDDLPYHLKHCFLHLANFPEDYEIPTEKLYQLWVAEGIVSTEDLYEREEDIADGYLNELVRRSMVQVASWVNGTNCKRINKCCLHDLTRDVCIEIAKKEGFLQTINCQAPNSYMDTKSNAENLFMTSLPERDKRLRRLAVYVTDDQEPQRSRTLPISTSAKVSRAPNLRSLLFFKTKEPKLGEENCRKFVETISNDFPLLRVLDCENLRIEGKLPKKVANLIHLKYLGLANTRINKIPSSVEMLWWLQTLDLRVQHDVVLSIPNVLWKMKQLRHVYFPLGSLMLQDRNNYGPRYSIKGGGLLRIDGLCNLQTLMHIDLDRLDVEGLKMSKKRLKLVSAICGTKKEALDHLLKGSSSMKSFTLRLHARIIDENQTDLWSNCEAMCCHLTIYVELNYNYCLRQLCLEMVPKNLVSLDIWYVILENDPLPVLERLPSLVVLGLHACYSGQMMACSASGFRELIDLYFDCLSNFRDWQVEQGALAKLKRLRVHGCSLKNVPDVLPSSVNVVRNYWDLDRELDESQSSVKQAELRSRFYFHFPSYG